MYWLVHFALAGFTQHNIDRSEKALADVVAAIVAFLHNLLATAIDKTELANLSATITGAFTNLKQKKEHGYASFSSSPDGNRSSFEYRILCAVADPNLKEYFNSFVTTIKLEADIKSESDWWELAPSTQKDFSVKFDSGQFIVNKDFTCGST